MAKRTKPCSTVHPPYPEMMSDATLILEDQAVSTWPAVSEFIGKPLPSGSDRSLFVPMRKLVESERLLKVKSSCKGVSLTENVGIPEKEATKGQKATRKTRRLSQVETPEALRKATRKRKMKAMVSEVDGLNGGKMKRLSQVKTPEGFKNGDKKNTKKMKRNRKARVPEVDGRNGGKMKRLSQVKTPEGFKKGDKKHTKKKMETRQ